MADEKKPKIDLKARLGKTAVGGATPPPPAAVGGAIPMPGPAAAAPALAGNAGSGGYAPAPIPTPAAVKPVGGLPVPPGIPVGPPPAFKSPAMNLDPSNPLAAAMAQPAPARTQPPAPPPQPQRIEVDELTVQEARKGARKQGLVAGIVFGVVLGAVGYIAGGAHETNKGRAQSVAHAKSLAGDVATSREQLKALGEKLEAGRDTLAKEKKFPDSLAKDLSAINVDFDGTKLAGVRFSGFSQETTTGLIEYITGVQSTNDRKNALMGLLAKLQKPMTEQLAAQSSGKPPPVTFVVLLDKDSAKNPFAVLAPLQKPIELSAAMPAEFTATDPRRRANVTAPKLTSIDKPGAAYVVPQSIDAAFPSETAGQIGQLVGQLSRLINDVRGEGPTPGEAISEPKPGLLERADRLVANLNKVQ
ncbi:MAG: hypothetical protein KF764_27665 [Labilithrix sp.]|nr:hypothetical protein [Labilithrix sp.]